MKGIKINTLPAIVMASIIGLSIYSCKKDFLNKIPVGPLDPEGIQNRNGVEGLLIGAYSVLDGYGSANSGWETAGSNWVYGSVASDDSYKGSDPGDQPDIVPIETYTATSSDYYFNSKWNTLFDGIQRSNDVLRIMRLATDITPEDT